MAKIFGLGLRALEFAFTVILLGLVGALEHQSSDNPESVHFSMFTAAFSILFLLYLIPATWSESLAGHPMILIVIDALNTVFFFCAAVTLSARTRGHSCGDHVRSLFYSYPLNVTLIFALTELDQLQLSCQGILKPMPRGASGNCLLLVWLGQLHGQSRAVSCRGQINCQPPSSHSVPTPWHVSGVRWPAQLYIRPHSL